MNPSALIIGAGPAGSIAAILLSRARWNVYLIEQHHFPHDKVCGECLSALGFEVLDRLGLGKRFIQELSPVRIAKSRIHSSNGKDLRIALPQPMWGISRLRLDEWLCSVAVNAGANLRQLTRCEAVMDGTPPQVRIRDLATNEMQPLRADFVLLADGKGALLPTRPPTTNDLGIKAHFESITADRNAIDLFSVHGHYGGVAPIENNSWNVAFSVPQQKVREHNGNLDALFASLLNENRSLAERFAHAKRITPWLASPLPRSAVSTHWPRNVIPLGNAAAAIEPIGGEGMGLAMRSAELAANMLIENRFDETALRAQFHQLWRYRSFACRAVAKAVSHRRLANLALPILKPVPRCWLLTAMGK